MELGSFDDGGHTVEIEFYEGYMVVADRSGGLEIFDITDPANITKIAEHNDGGDAAGIEIVNDLIFLADGDDGLEILQIVVNTPTTSEELLPVEIIIVGGTLGAVALIAVILIVIKRKR